MGDGDNGQVGASCEMSGVDNHSVIALEAGMRVRVIGFEAGRGDRHRGDDGHRPLRLPVQEQHGGGWPAALGGFGLRVGDEIAAAAARTGVPVAGRPDAFGGLSEIGRAHV